MPYQEEYEKVINIRDLFFYVLKKWRWLLLFLLIGLIAGGAYSYKQMRDNRPELIEAAIQEMDEDKLHMETIKQYADYNALYKSQLASEEESVLLQLDPQAVWTGEIRYFVNATKSSIPYIRAEFESLLRQSENVERLIQAYGSGVTESQIRGLVTINVGNRDETDKASSVEGTVAPEDYSGAINNNTAIINVQVTVGEEAVCKSLLNVVHELIEEKNTELENDLGETFSSNELSENVWFGYNELVQKALQKAVESRKNYLSQISSVKKELSKDELLYYDYFYGNYKADEPIGFSLKWVVLFGIAGIIICVAWFAVRYLLDTRVKTTDDVYNYGISVIGVLPDPSAKTSLVPDRLLSQWEKRGKASTNDIEYVSSVIKALDFKQAILSTNNTDVEEKELLNQLASADPRLIVTGNLGEDKDAQMVLKESEGVILLIKLYRTRDAQVQREISVVSAIGKKILGAVVIE